MYKNAQSAACALMGERKQQRGYQRNILIAGCGLAVVPLRTYFFPMATLIFQKGRGGYHGKTEPGLGTDKHTRDKCLVVYTLRHQVVSQVL